MFENLEIYMRAVYSPGSVKEREWAIPRHPLIVAAVLGCAADWCER